MSSPALPLLLSIVIVSFNTRYLLRRCLASIVDKPNHWIVGDQGQEPPLPLAEGRGEDMPDSRLSTLDSLPVEVLVVDNSSDDGSADMVERDFPAVHLVRAGGNLGFARATNLGLRESRGNLLLLLNPDTEVVGNALNTMASFLLGQERVAAVGPALVYPDGRPQHGAFRFPTLWMSFFDFFPLNHRMVDSRLNGRYPAPTDGRPFPMDHPLGAAMMVRREALEDVGLLDESFFMYCEEVDWCLRARRRGWQIYQVPAAKVVHHAGQSTGLVRDEMLVELHRSRYLLFRKHYSPGFLRIHRLITRAGLMRRGAEATWEALRGRLSREQLARRLRALQTIWNM